jgi:hypothetical protein
MKKILFITIFFSIIFVFFSSWFVINKDLIFHTDIARDFLLIDEIANKKITLIGPRADWKGLFHGPLWLYFNLPAFLIGQGNPIIVAWYWIFILILFSIFYYLAIKKVFDKKTALLFIPLFLSSMVTFSSNFYNPIGALLLMPLLYVLIIKYQKTNKMLFLALSLLISGLMFQFQLAVGGPMLILTSLYALYQIIKNKTPKHLLAFLILFIPLSTFILFDLRHDFMQFRAVINHFNGVEKYNSISLIDKITNRIGTITNQGLGFFKDKFSFLNLVIGSLISIIISYLFYKKKFKTEYFLFLYFFVGFYILSIFYQGVLLIHYYLPLTPLPLLVFSSFNEKINKKIFYIFYLIIIFANIFTGLKQISFANKYIGKDKTSWSGLLNVAKTTYTNLDRSEFGLYLYAPDMYGYSQKYAFLYGQTLYPNKKMVFSQKRNITFLIYEPAPQSMPWLDGSGWKSGLVKIDKEPIQTIKFPNGFRMEKYILTDEELTIQSDSILNDWVSQR